MKGKPVDPANDPLVRRTPAEAEPIFLANKGLAYKTVRAMFPFNSEDLLRIGDRDDAIQIALAALWLACLRWDESRCKITTFGVSYIRGYLKSARDDGGVIHCPRACTNEDFNRAREMARNLWDLDRPVGYQPGALRQYDALCIKRGTPLANLLVDPHGSDPVEIIAHHDEIKWRMAEVKKSLKGIPRHRQRAFWDKVLKGMSPAKMEKKYKAGRSSINNWVRECMNRLKERLGEAE